MIAIFGAVILSNGISHSVTAIWDRGYGPGLITSILWIPLGAFAMYDMYLTGQITNLKLGIALAIGIGINGGVAFFTMKGGKLWSLDTLLGRNKGKDV